MTRLISGLVALALLVVAVGNVQAEVIDYGGDSGITGTYQGSDPLFL
jgi:hypothetical protein